MKRYREVQQRSYRKTFLTSGVRHGKFQSILTAISPEGGKKVSEVASVLVPNGEHEHGWARPPRTRAS